jgi:hypothetical protein
MTDPWAAFRPQQPATPDPWAAFRAPAMAQQTPPAATPEQPMPGYAEDMAKGFGSGLAKGVAGVVGLPRTVAELGYKGADWVAEKMGVQDRAPMGDTFDALPSYQGTVKAIEGKTGPLYEPKTIPGQYAQTAGEFAPGALFPGGAVARATNVIAPAVGAETGGQLFKGTDYENTARLVGGVAGGVLGPRAVTPLPQTAASPTRNAHVATLQAEGVPLTAGQTSGRKALRWAESAADDMPFSGGGAARVQQQSAEQFTRAAMQRVGEQNATRATPQVMDNVYRRIGGEFDQLAANNTLRDNGQLVSRFQRIMDDYHDVVPENARAGIVGGTMRDLQAELAKGQGAISGELYQAWRSRLDKAARGIGHKDPPLQDAVFSMRNALDDAMQASISPAEQLRWAAARKQYRNLMAIERSMRGAGEATADGLISPSKLRNAVEQQGARNYVKGRGDLNELARAGEAIMKPLPQSGTAPRLAAQGLAGAIGGMAAGMPGAMMGVVGQGMGARALMSGPMQRYLSNQVLPAQQLGALSYARPPIWAQLPQMNERDR